MFYESSQISVRIRLALKVRQSLFPHQEPFLLHATVLEPDFDLLVREIELVRQFPPPLSSDELIEDKLTL